MKRRPLREYRLVFASIVLAVLAALAGCDSEQEASTESPLPGFEEAAVGDGKEEIVFAVHPYASAVSLTREFAPLLDYLSKRTGRPVSMLVAKDYETHITRVGSDEVDIALMGPASYVTMCEQFGPKRLLCCLETNGTPDFQGYIIVRKDNPATSLEDLQGKSFASSSRKSTMSYVVPRYMFIEAGIPFPESYLRIVGSHNNVCLNVLTGDVNAGGIREKTYIKYKDRDLKVITTTPRVAQHPFVATDHLDAETYGLVKEALLGIKSRDDVTRLLTPLKASLTGLAPIEDKDYDKLREMMTVVREDERLSPEERQQVK
jgi:phosphonate transport system substrate-binding protein